MERQKNGKYREMGKKTEGGPICVCDGEKRVGNHISEVPVT